MTTKYWRDLIAPINAREWTVALLVGVAALGSMWGWKN